GEPAAGPVTDLEAATVGGRWCLYAGVKKEAPLAGGLYRSCTDENGLLEPWTHVPVQEGGLSSIDVVKIGVAASGKTVYASLFDNADQLRLYRSDKPWDSCPVPSDCWKFVSLYDIAHEEDPTPTHGYKRSGYCNWNPASPNPQQPNNCRHSHTLT